MDPTLEEAAPAAGSSNWQVFPKVTFSLALPSVLAVLILTFVRSLEAFEIPALIGLPASVEVLTAKIYLQIRTGILPRYGEASAYSVLLIALVGGVLFLYHRVTAQGPHAGLFSIHRELEESSAACGGSWLQTARKILFPLLLPTLFASWIYVFLITLRELSVALLSYSPGRRSGPWRSGSCGKTAASAKSQRSVWFLLFAPSSSPVCSAGWRTATASTNRFSATLFSGGAR